MFSQLRSKRCPLERTRRSSSAPFLFEILEVRQMFAGTSVLDWNAVALEAVKNDYALGDTPDQPGPSASARALAMVHLAIYDAVMAIDRRYMPYLFNVHATKNASMDAAVAQAAHDTLSALFPRQTSLFDAELAESFVGIKTGPRASGVALGRRVAAAMMADRIDDGAVDMMTFTPGTQPGEWRPDPLHPSQVAWGPNWGDVTPFVMKSAADFAIPPAPELTSAEYAAAFNEVKSLGGDGITTPTARTAEQTEIGIFWAYDGVPGMGTPPRLYNQVARVIAEQEGNTEVENARLFAMVNVALADAGIAAWDSKYLENFWRPITAIREADPGTGPSGLGDGNPDTVGDPTWTPLGAPASNGAGTNFTPPFPAYSSGHATFGAAAFGAIREFYGTDDIAFSFTSDEMNGVTRDANGNVRPAVTRSYSSLSEAIEENGISRIYLGIHWRFDMTAGIDQGNAIAEYVAHHFASKRPPHGLPFWCIANNAVKAVESFIDSAIAAIDLNVTRKDLVQVAPSTPRSLVHDVASRSLPQTGTEIAGASLTETAPDAVTSSARPAKLLATNVKLR